MKISVFLFILFFSTQLFSQDYQIGIGVGYLKIDSPSYLTNDPGILYGRITIPGVGVSAFPSLGFDNAVIYYGKIKYNIPKTRLSLISSFSYSKPTGSTMVIRTNETVENPYPTNLMYLSTDVTISKSIITFGLGGQWNLLTSKNTPYLMSEIFLFSFGETITNFKNSIREFNDIKEGMTRVGGSLGLGMNLDLYEYISFDLGFKYNINNIFKNIENEKIIKTYSIYSILVFNLNI